jgi:hypothetical protein
VLFVWPHAEVMTSHGAGSVYHSPQIRTPVFLSFISISKSKVPWNDVGVKRDSAKSKPSQQKCNVFVTSHLRLPLHDDSHVMNVTLGERHNIRDISVLLFSSSQN